MAAARGRSPRRGSLSAETRAVFAVRAGVTETALPAQTRAAPDRSAYLRRQLGAALANGIKARSRRGAKLRISDRRHALGLIFCRIVCWKCGDVLTDREVRGIFAVYDNQARASLQICAGLDATGVRNYI